MPSDTVGQFADDITLVYNAIDVYNADTEGNFNANVISITPSTDAVAGSLVEVNYIANVSTLLPSVTLSDLPIIRNANGYDTNTKTG